MDNSTYPPTNWQPPASGPQQIGQHPAPPPAPRRSKKKLWIILVAVLVVLVGTAATVVTLHLLPKGPVSGARPSNTDSFLDNRYADGYREFTFDLAGVTWFLGATPDRSRIALEDIARDRTRSISIWDPNKRDERLAGWQVEGCTSVTPKGLTYCTYRQRGKYLLATIDLASASIKNTFEVANSLAEPVFFGTRDGEDIIGDPRYAAFYAIKDGEKRVLHSEGGEAKIAKCVAVADYEKLVCISRISGSDEFTITVYDTKSGKQEAARKTQSKEITIANDGWLEKSNDTDSNPATYIYDTYGLDGQKREQTKTNNRYLIKPQSDPENGKTGLTPISYTLATLTADIPSVVVNSEGEETLRAKWDDKSKVTERTYVRRDGKSITLTDDATVGSASLDGSLILATNSKNKNAQLIDTATGSTLLTAKNLDNSPLTIRNNVFALKTSDSSGKEKLTIYLPGK
jgi:hypothetical protein